MRTRSFAVCLMSDPAILAYSTFADGGNSGVGITEQPTFTQDGWPRSEVSGRHSCASPLSRLYRLARGNEAAFDGAHGADAGVEEGERSRRSVAAEVEALLGQRPDLQLVKIADGAKDNWTFLSRVLPEGVESSTSSTPPSISRGPSMRPWGRRPQADGACSRSTVIGASRDRLESRRSSGATNLCSKHPECERLAQVLGYFRDNRHRMGYAREPLAGM